MKVKLNADWLEPDNKSKFLWIQEVRKYFHFTSAQIKPLADFFWSQTENLTLSKELIVDTSDFAILNSFGKENSIDDVWISYSKAIQHHHTDEEKKRLEYQANPFLEREEKLAEEIKKLMDLIPEDKLKQVEEALKRVLAVNSSFSGPFAS